MMDSLRPYFDDYATRYMAGDAAGIAALCVTPFSAIRSGVVHHLADRAALVAHLEGNMQAYRAAGATAADIVGLTVLEQGTAAALVTIHWRVRGSEDRIVRDFSTSYQLVAADPWLIVSYVNHDEVPKPA